MKKLAFMFACLLLLAGCGNAGSSAPGSGGASSSVPLYVLPSSESVPASSSREGTSSLPASSAPSAAPSSSASAAPPAATGKGAFLADFLLNHLPPADAPATLQNSKEGRAERLAKIKAQLETMVQAGVFPEDLRDKLLPYMDAESVNFTRHTDFTTYDNMVCNFGLGTRPAFYVASITAEEENLTYSFSGCVPVEYQITDEERRAMLLSYIEYLGLQEAFDDWEEHVPSSEGGNVNLFFSQSAGLQASVSWHDNTPGQLIWGFNVLEMQDWLVSK